MTLATNVRIFTGRYVALFFSNWALPLGVNPAYVKINSLLWYIFNGTRSLHRLNFIKLSAVCYERFENITNMKVAIEIRTVKETIGSGGPQLFSWVLLLSLEIIHALHSLPCSLFPDRVRLLSSRYRTPPVIQLDSPSPSLSPVWRYRDEITHSL